MLYVHPAINPGVIYVHPAINQVVYAGHATRVVYAGHATRVVYEERSHEAHSTLERW